MERIFSKPNIVISKCLNFDNCRYNWDKINDDFLLKLWKYVNYIPVCPEVAIWLWTPRMPLRLHLDDKENTRLYQPSSKTDFTEKMKKFSIDFLSKTENTDGFIMKNRSPSCGIWDVKVYNKIDSHVSTQRSWSGIFWDEIRQEYRWYPTEDEWRLKNFRIREDFLSKIFCLADFKELQDIKALIDFQAKNKYLFMAYNQNTQKELWRIIASYNKDNFDEIYSEYKDWLITLFSTRNSTKKLSNAYMHIFWYFKESCTKEEKEFFLESLDMFKDDRIPNSSVINMLKIWALRDKNDYIINQTILNPFPKELIELSNSWKSLKL